MAPNRASWPSGGQLYHALPTENVDEEAGAGGGGGTGRLDCIWHSIILQPLLRPVAAELLCNITTASWRNVCMMHDAPHASTSIISCERTAKQRNTSPKIKCGV